MCDDKEQCKQTLKPSKTMQANSEIIGEKGKIEYLRRFDTKVVNSNAVS